MRQSLRRQGRPQSYSPRPILITLDAEGLFEFGGKLHERGGDLRGLFNERAGHAFGHLRLGADKFRGRQDQGQLVVDIVAHVGKLLVQLANLFDRQSDGLRG